MILLKNFVKALDLEILEPGPNKELPISVADISRPGLQLSGFFDYFATERVQIIGHAEMEYLLALPPTVRQERIQRYMNHPLPVVVLSRDMPCPPELLEAARRYNIPLLRSKMVTTRLSVMVAAYISGELAPRITRHGVLLDVFGIGVMITGESGVGKSEAALELVKRGHRLVADDVVDIKKVSDTRLTGAAPDIVRNFMEIRGVGIINVQNMYGVGAVIESKSIEMNVHLELWDDAKEYDRLGFNEEFTAILGVKVPMIVLPVRPGRNLAIVIEVAASNYRLKSLGYHGAKELNERLLVRTRENEEDDIP
ncbi:MAG: HPr(Ser) kinase/phosphatase [Christensenellaceae bacterium]|jgi:HPr kinase/phosphorylase|nr:HPr(Ser) kinase/phosphatase [Christensenellaceae bacterium]